MGYRQTPWTEIFSCATIGLSLACLSGLALGHVTEQSMHPRLSSQAPADPVERYALGQNAFARPSVKATQAPAAQYADASIEIGSYQQGVRILAPEEPARKRDRLRLERLQAWNEENFGGDAGGNAGAAEHADRSVADDAPIDVGAVAAAPESMVPRIIRTGSDAGGIKPRRIAMDLRPVPAPNESSFQARLPGS
ncbi:hypothetical protein [Parasphingorhabdus sp.]|uniref:hypothetical protein n=1 Tax=Parasphingorhabdus sp. TaxID=2709688 RepID=UPI003002BC99